MTKRNLNHSIQLVSPFPLLSEKKLKMIHSEKVVFFSLNLNHNLWYSMYRTKIKKFYHHKGSIYGNSHNTHPITEVTNCLHGSNTPLNDEMENQEASGSAPSIARNYSVTP